MTSTFVKKSFKVHKPISKGKHLFKCVIFLNASVQSYLYKTPVQMAKHIHQTRKLTHQHFIQKNSTNRDFLSFENCFFFLFDFNKTQQNLLF